MDPLAQLQALIEEIKSTQIDDAAALEAFRIRFLGSKNILKPLSQSIREVPNERKKEFGQLVNEAKSHAETLFESTQARLSGGAKSVLDIPDMTLPGIPTPLGSR